MNKYEVGKIYKLSKEFSSPFSYIKIEDSAPDHTEVPDNAVFGQTIRKDGSPKSLRAVIAKIFIEEEMVFDKSVIQSGKTYNITGGIFKGDVIEVMHRTIKTRPQKYHGKVFLEGSDLFQELTIDADHIGEEV